MSKQHVDAIFNGVKTIIDSKQLLLQLVLASNRMGMIQLASELEEIADAIEAAAFSMRKAYVESIGDRLKST